MTKYLYHTQTTCARCTAWPCFHQFVVPRAHCPITVADKVGVYSYLVHDGGLSMSSISACATSDYRLAIDFG